MDIAVSVLAVAQTAFKTAKSLHELASKYQNAKTAITALQVQTTTIAWSIRSLHLILDLRDPDTSDLVRKRFEELPELEENLTVSIAGCEMVLACLDAEIERLFDGSSKSTTAKVKAKWLWKENDMKELLQTLHGMHAAVLAILQCFQMRGISELHSQLGQLCQVVQANHGGVEKILKHTPFFRQTPESPLVREKDELQADQTFLEPSLLSSVDEEKSTVSRSSSEERVVNAYHQYQNAFSRTASVRSKNEEASIVGIAPSSIYRKALTKKSDDRVSTLQELQVPNHLATKPTWIQSWIQRQPSYDNLGAGAGVQANRIVSLYCGEGDNMSINAPDLKTFLDYIQNFMPAVVDREEMAPEACMDWESASAVFEEPNDAARTMTDDPTSEESKEPDNEGGQIEPSSPRLPFCIPEAKGIEATAEAEAMDDAAFTNSSGANSSARAVVFAEERDRETDSPHFYIVSPRRSVQYSVGSVPSSTIRDVRLSAGFSPDLFMPIPDLAEAPPQETNSGRSAFEDGGSLTMNARRSQPSGLDQQDASEDKNDESRSSQLAPFLDETDELAKLDSPAVRSSSRRSSASEMSLMGWELDETARLTPESVWSLV